MMWWRWTMAGAEALLLTVLVLLVYDWLRERDGIPLARATKITLAIAPIIPLGFLLALLVPLWVGLILIAVPALAVAVMALAS